MEDPEGLETVLDGQNIIVVKGIDKEKLASMLLKSEQRELRNLTRARVLSMLMKLSDVKSVRLVRNN